eukprot:6403048-Alexandrium_andersonii.AAC.1
MRFRVAQNAGLRPPAASDADGVQRPVALKGILTVTAVPQGVRWARPPPQVSTGTMPLLTEPVGRQAEQLVGGLQGALAGDQHGRGGVEVWPDPLASASPVSYTHLRAHETSAHL